MATTHEPRVSPQAPERPSAAGWVRSFRQQPLGALRFARSRDALIGGVAGGLGERWGVDAVLVRIAFVVLSWAGAVGVLGYIIAWSVSLDPGDRRAPRPKPATMPQGIAFASIVVGATLLARSSGLWLGDKVGIPLLISAIGAGVVYVGSGERGPRWLRGGINRSAQAGRPSIATLVIGGIFAVGGVIWFLIINQSFSGLMAVLIAVAVTTFGLAIVFGPWVYRLLNQVGEERRDRIRSEERAELAAHLHDSVLQTLALIQRNAGNARKMANLARRQERELRAWLYGQFELSGHMESAMHEMADGVEEAYDVTIETVIVGDCPLDERTAAVVAACREAATNAARHSGTPEISVYVECDGDVVTAYVRDRGDGFDPDAVSDGRRGIADSIRGRIDRHGGSVTITTAPGEGCEVQIAMPVERTS